MRVRVPNQRAVLTTQGTGQEDFVLDRCHFQIGDIRSKTWMVTGSKVSSLLGNILQAAQAGTLMVPISRQEYMSRKAAIHSKGGKGGKGGGKGAGKVARLQWSPWTSTTVTWVP